ncbi:MAG: efflux RND transporter periplasmic adaptor subunit [Treponema sp.]|nr:efflux RND transporter periplasmic adaptor subunit [Treponema sp.]
MRKSHIVMACAAAAMVAVVAYVAISKKSGGNAGMGKGRGRGSGNTVFTVKTETVQKETLHGYVIANGEIESQNSVNVFPDVSGKIMETNVMLGSSVRRGDVIAYVDPNSPGQYYKKSPVYAPINGSIISTPLKNGTTVSTSTVIAIVGDIANLQVSADIPERYVAVLKPGLKAEVSVEAYPGVVFNATVTRVSPVVDTTSRTKEVILHFDERDSRVNAGMFGKIKLYTQDYAGEVTMPADALVSLNDEYYAYVVKEGGDTVERRKVKTGQSVDGRIQILEGVNEGEKVVIQGQTSLNDGSKIRDITNGTTKNEQAEAGNEKKSENPERKERSGERSGKGEGANGERSGERK